ncbi:metallopeptidase family protein [Patescibacteria group bacterium]|nr:metallopeptidase family protein [Patescibacteria group bacterium]MBU1473035.1 metallopeptidase family protein [Patescibacteria group bacterium]MBU2460209.1 metallopeptidase family protein [Patescibacteria group bacterium]MBU2543904.1 metallopeptidase family protein [Patescibacteria group bacterium]
MTRKDFEQLVADALDSLPQKFGKQVDNMEVVVEVWPTREDLQNVGVGHGTTLYGLYRGVAKTRRANYSGVLPDIIVIYAGPILAHFGTDPAAVKAQVRKTVLHEIGHHLGLSEEEMHRAQDNI